MTAVTIDTPDGIVLRMELQSGLMTLVNQSGQSFTFTAQYIPEVRAVLLDFEREYWCSEAMKGRRDE